MTVSPEKCADAQWQILLDKDDRTSPEEYPDMALITRGELASVVSASINEALETGAVLPKLANCGHYIAEDNKGQWHYINHANTWQGYPGPQTPEALRQLSGITEETSSWQPIETAPKDGTWFLGWVQRGDTEDRYDIWQWDANVETDSGYGFWINAADSNLDEFPTHWQPLPKDPTHDQS